MFFEVAERRFIIGFEILLSRTGDDAAACAVAAVSGAAIRHQKQNPVGVAVDEPGNGHMAVFAAGIGHFIGGNERLLDAGNHLPANWAVGIVAVDQIEEVRRNGHGELRARENDPVALVFAEVEVFLQLGEGGDPVF